MKKKTILKNIILLLSIVIFLVILIVSMGDIKSIFNILASANYFWLLIIIGLMFLYFILWPLSLTILIRKEDKHIKRKDAYLISSSEFFFNGITPFSSGGQPFQAYALKQKGMKLSSSTSVLMLNFIIYQFVINAFSILALSLYFDKIKTVIPNLIWVAVIGFSMNFLILILLILLAVSSKIATFIHNFLTFLAKRRLFKKIEGAIPTFDQYVIEVQSAFKAMRKQIFTISISLLLKIIGLLIYYAVPFFGLLALNINIGVENLFLVIAMTCFSLTMVTWIPTPGSSGGAELTFSAIFILFAISSDVNISLMLIWRLCTYYFTMVYGFVTYILYERGRKKDEDRNLHGHLLSNN